ncbi:MAG: hypothetical protein IPF99_30510 [Deltaproteobacteria bacterium]|nr:hypothetical protein [Deltaproteobacteria bacterium]
MTTMVSESTATDSIWLSRPMRKTPVSVCSQQVMAAAPGISMASITVYSGEEPST